MDSAVADVGAWLVRDKILAWCFLLLASFILAGCGPQVSDKEQTDKANAVANFAKTHSKDADKVEK